VLFHLPLSYQDRTRVVPNGALRTGQEQGTWSAAGRARLPGVGGRASAALAAVQG